MKKFETSYEPTPLLEWLEDKTVKTIPQLFDATVKTNPTIRFLGQKIDGEYSYETYEAVAEKVDQFASSLLVLGIQPGDRIAQISNNRPEWVVTDLGTMACGAVHAPLYSTVSKTALAYILNDSGARFLVLESLEHLDLLKSCVEELSHLEGVISLVPFRASEFHKLKMWNWNDFLQVGKESLEHNKATITDRKMAIKGTDVCSLIYTSGTTGEPKGAMLMHGNFLSNSVCVAPLIPVSPGEVELSFLPLSHVFERTLYYMMITIGGTIAYAESFETVRDNLIEVRPHLVASVPRLYEKIYSGVFAKAEQEVAMKRMKRRILNWALEVGKRHFEAKLKGSMPAFLAAQNKLAHRLVFSKIQAKTGGRIKVFASGGAPLRADVCEFFLSAGFQIVEGYGLTETSPVITMNPLERPKVGTVGKTIEHVEIKIAKDGEILTRGPHVMLGYFNKKSATSESIDADGWFYTGDIGEIDSEGYLRITDRKKEIIVLSNGKNVAPSPIEQAIKESKYIEQCVVIGDKRNFISALIVPSYENLTSWCKENDCTTEAGSMAENPKLIEFLSQITLDACKDFSPFERVKKIAVLARDLSQDNGELTPTLKVKRRVVTENFEDKIESIYSSSKAH